MADVDLHGVISPQVVELLSHGGRTFLPATLSEIPPFETTIQVRATSEHDSVLQSKSSERPQDFTKVRLRNSNFAKIHSSLSCRARVVMAGRSL